MTWPRFARRPLAIIGLGAVVLSGAGCDTPRAPADIVVEDLVEDVLQRPTPSIGRLAALDPGDALRGDGARTAARVEPDQPLRWELTVPPHAALRFGVGVEGEKRRDDTRSGLVFTLSIDGSIAFTRTVNPAAHRSDRRWWDERVSLAAFAGRTVEIEARVAPETPRLAPAGRAGWSRVRLVRETRVPRRPAADGPNLLVVLVDTLRADAVGCFGATPSPTPNLDALAARGTAFDTAVAQSSWTLPSVASLLTGLPPRQHGAVGHRERRDDGTHGDARWGFLADPIDTWPEIAAHAGYTTFGASANPLVSRGTNLAQGFETFVELPWDPQGRNWASATAVHDAFDDWLDVHRETRFVAYLHVMEPHDPYTPLAPPAPPPGLRPALLSGWIRDVANKINWGGGPTLQPHELAHLRQLYAAEVATWDRALGALLARLHSRRLLDRTIVIVTADHGEEFQEHGRLTHGSHLYEESIRVPLVVAGPGVPIGRRPDLTQGIDLLPTILHLLGLPPRGDLPGRSLLGDLTPPAGAVMETSSGIAPDGTAIDLVAVRSADTKLITTPALDRTESYDLVADPAEMRDQGPTSPHARRLRDLLARWHAATPPAPVTHHRDATFADKLRALGYAQ